MKMFLNIILAFSLPFFMACSNHTEPEIYLIPKGYVGIVNIIFNQKNGTPLKYENGKRVYEIPSNGILLTQFEAEFGKVDREFFYFDEKGKRQNLKIIQDYEINEGSVNNKNEIAIYNQVTGVYGNENIPYQGFEVSSFDSLANANGYNDFRKKIKEILHYDF